MSYHILTSVMFISILTTCNNLVLVYKCIDKNASMTYDEAMYWTKRTSRTSVERNTNSEIRPDLFTLNWDSYVIGLPIFEIFDNRFNCPLRLARCFALYPARYQISGEGSHSKVNRSVIAHTRRRGLDFHIHWIFAPHKYGSYTVRH